MVIVICLIFVFCDLRFKNFDELVKSTNSSSVWCFVFEVFLRQLLGFACTPQQLNPILDPVFDILFDRRIDLARIVFFPVI